jgi:hypothetical protein
MEVLNLSPSDQEALSVYDFYLCKAYIDRMNEEAKSRG